MQWLHEGFRGAQPRSARFWCAWILVAFYATYPLANWLASWRGRRYDFLTPWDAQIPLVPEWIWVYFSFFVFLLLPLALVDADEFDALGRRMVLATLVCGLCFVLLPANLAFARSLPEAEPYRSIFAMMFALDHPHNLLPSLHIVYSAGCAAAVCKSQWRQWRWRRAWLCALLAWWALAICASTVLVHQHQVLDVVAALVLVALLQWAIRPRPVAGI